MYKFPDNWSELNVVLCHDWLTGMRGGERVLEVLCRGFPEATVFTLLHNKQAISKTINTHPIKTSYMQNIPGITNHYRYFLPFFSSAIEQMQPPESDLLISTSHCIAKGIKTHKSTKHLCYCFTPMRYAWLFYKEYFGNNPVKSIILRPLLSHLRKWDKNTSYRVDRFVAISRHVQKRIMNFYGRESDIVYPPVDTKRLTPDKNQTPLNKCNFDLIVSALVPYKQINLAIKAYTKLGYPLKVVGIGGELDKLRSIAGNNIQFLEWQSDDNILKLYRTCRMLIFPGEEDFGIVPVEAQACGKPVVAYSRGGALETIKENITGVFFHNQTEKALINAVKKCSSMTWNISIIRSNAEQFSIQNFINSLSESINACLKDN